VESLQRECVPEAGGDRRSSGGPGHGQCGLSTDRSCSWSDVNAAFSVSLSPNGMMFPQSDKVHKSVFIIFFQGDQLKNRVKKICEGYVPPQHSGQYLGSVVQPQILLLSFFFFFFPFFLLLLLFSLIPSSGSERPCTRVQKHPRRGKRCWRG